MRQTWVPSLHWEDPLEEGMATHSSILAWKIPMDKGAWPATVHGIGQWNTAERLSTAQHKLTLGWELGTYTSCLPWFPFLSPILEMFNSLHVPGTNWDH